ncbi:MAG: hypothetical protein RL757_3123 [Bacteroidota bacterium]|jgi:transcriptional regulator
MYINKINDESGEHQKALDFMEKNAFALLVSTDELGFPHATHLPISVEFDDTGNLKLTGHIAKANFIWQQWEKNDRVLVVFSGAHAYISSSWYEKSNVSTWNYLTVHAHGHIGIVSDPEAMKEMLRKLTERYESSMEKPRLMETMDQNDVKKEMRGLVCFEILVTKLQFSAKLSQNRNDKDYQNIIKKLDESDDTDVKNVATEMKKRRD